MKILVVDDHALVREGLRHSLKQLDPAAIVFEAQDSASALRSAEGHPDLDLVLLDLSLPGSDGFFALSNLRQQHPTIPVVMLSANDDHRIVARAIERGAMGFIPKSAPTAQMISALRLVMAGEVYLPPAALARSVANKTASKRRQPPRLATELALTERQTEVLKLLAEGESNKTIGHRLGMSEATVKGHIGRIFKALKVTSRTQAVVALKQHERGTDTSETT